MILNNFKIALILLSIVAFTTSYMFTEAQATDPNWHGHKWYWEKTDYRYGSMNGFTGLTQSEIYAALDAARAEVGGASDYDVNRAYYGTDWITKTYWSSVTKYGSQYSQHNAFGYIAGSDIELNYNSNITWYDGTSTQTPNIRAVAVHEMFHGADMRHVYSSGSAMFFSYDYYQWESLSDDDEDKLVEIYGSV